MRHLVMRSRDIRPYRQMRLRLMSMPCHGGSPKSPVRHGQMRGPSMRPSLMLKAVSLKGRTPAAEWKCSRRARVWPTLSGADAWRLRTGRSAWTFPTFSEIRTQSTDQLSRSALCGRGIQLRPFFSRSRSPSPQPASSYGFRPASSAGIRISFPHAAPDAPSADLWADLPRLRSRPPLKARFRSVARRPVSGPLPPHLKSLTCFDTPLDAGTSKVL